MADRATTEIEERDQRAVTSQIIREIRAENEQALGFLQSIAEGQRAFVVCRWRMGRLINDLLGSEIAAYGSGAAEHIASETGLHVNTIYDCRRFFLAVPDGPEQWIDSVVERYGIVLWKNARALWIDKTDEETLGVDGAHERRLHRIERRAEQLEHDMQEVARNARSNDVTPDLKRETLGVAERVLDVTQGGFTDHAKPRTPRDSAHLAYVRQLPCAFCGQVPPSDPHHVEKTATGKTGNDYSCVPMCRTCHELIPEIGIQTLQVQADITFGEAIAQTLAHRIGGQFIQLPKRRRLV